MEVIEKRQHVVLKKLFEDSILWKTDIGDKSKMPSGEPAPNSHAHGSE